MKKIVIIGCFLMVFIFATTAIADTITIRRINGYYTGNGGEFTLQVNDNGSSPDLNWVLPFYHGNTKDIGNHDPSFQSFCVEYSETINIGGTYNFTINDRAINGGVGSGGDPISVGTAWLYFQFAKGSLTGYNYTTGRSTSAGLLQAAIWWLEDERSDPGTGNFFRNLVLSNFGNDWALAKADNNGQYPVAVLNLYTLTGGLAQDQLVLTNVPVPASILLLGSGLLGLVGIARRRFKK